MDPWRHHLLAAVYGRIGAAPASRLLASAGKAWCTKPGGSSPEWIDFTKPVPSGPPAWIEPWDYTHVNLPPPHAHT